MLIKKRHREILFLIFVIVFFYGLCTAFSFKLNPLQDKGHYGLLAQSFLHQNLDLPIKPNPQLLTLPNPYDPIQNGAYRLHDASLYRGNYYLYWGPIPAITRVFFANQLPEQFFIFLYVSGCAIIYFFIVKKIKSDYFPKTNKIYFYFAILSGSFNGVILNLLASSGIYYEAIAAAQFFFLCGFFITLHYLSNPQNKYICFSSIFYTLSFASRISYLFPCLFIAIYYLVTSIKQKKKSVFSTLLSFSPYLTGLLLLGLYNYLRFGNFLEFGLQYQLAGIDMSLNYKNFTSIHNIPNNIQNYFFNFPSISSHLPFIFIDTKRYFNLERLVFSVFLISPITIFTLFHTKTGINVTRIKTFLLFVFVLFVFSISFFSPISATRYFFDFIFVFSLLGFISICSLHKNYKTILSLLPLSIIFIFFASTTYFKAIQEYHPKAYFNLNKFAYSLTHNSNIIDKTAYADLTLVTNKTRHLIINNAISRNVTVHLYPQTTQTYTTLNKEEISLTFVSFEPKITNLNLSYQNHLESNPKTVIQSLVIYPGINEIKIQGSEAPTELSDFELNE